MALFWLSFCDPDKEPGSQFLGVVIVEGDNSIDAVRQAHKLGCNPGGEVSIDCINHRTVPSALRNRLLSKADLTAASLI